MSSAPKSVNRRIIVKLSAPILSEAAQCLTVEKCFSKGFGIDAAEQHTWRDLYLSSHRVIVLSLPASSVRRGFALSV